MHNLRTYIEFFLIISCVLGDIKTMNVRTNYKMHNWPTYAHPENSTQLCFMCPPGYYLVEHCQLSDTCETTYSTCKTCEGGWVSEKWNKDSSCSKRTECLGSEPVTTSSTDFLHGVRDSSQQCCCPKGQMEEHGHCVPSVPRHKINRIISQRQKGATCPTCLDIGFSNLEKKLEYWHLAASFVTGVAVALLLTKLVMCYCTRKSQRGNFVYHTGRIVRRVEEATDNILVIQERDYSDNPIKSPTEGDSDSGFTISIHGSKKSFNSHDDDLWINGDSTSALNERGNSLKRRMVTVIFGEESNDNFFPPSSEDMRLDDACQIMESLVVSRPIDFIRKVFGLSIEDCERIEFAGHENTTGGKLSSLVRAGFQRWKQLNGLCATVENLIKALRCAERNDIADKIEDTLETSSIYKSSYKQAELNIAIGICKEVLELKNALPLFRQQMGLTEADISQVHGSDCVGVGLYTWKTKLGKYATVQHLLDCLEKAGLMSLYDDICQKLKITLPSSDEVQSTTSDCEATERCILLEETEPKSHNHDAGMSSGIPIIGHYVIDRP